MIPGGIVRSAIQSRRDDLVQVLRTARAEFDRASFAGRGTQLARATAAARSRPARPKAKPWVGT
jgi:hypothetical protein